MLIISSNINFQKDPFSIIRL